MKGLRAHNTTRARFIIIWLGTEKMGEKMKKKRLLGQVVVLNTRTYKGRKPPPPVQTIY